MVTTAELQRRGLRYAVSVDAAATNASLLDLQQKGLPYAVEVADGATMASRAALEARGLRYFVPVAVGATAASRAALDRQGLRYAVPVDADILPADRLVLDRQGLRYFVAVDSSGNSVAAGAAGGAALLTGETNGFATDFTYTTDASRVAVKTAGTVVSSGLDTFFQNAGLSPKYVFNAAGALIWSPHNLVVQSQNLQVSWTLTNCTAPAATSLLPSVTLGVHRAIGVAIIAVVGETYTFSAAVSASGYSKIGVTTVAGGEMAFDLSAGTILYQSGYTGTISPQGGGQYLITVTAVAVGSIGFIIYVLPDSYTTGSFTASTWSGDGVKGVNIHRSQMNRGAVPTAYLATTTVARFGLAVDHDPTTHVAKGLLLESAVTNLLLNNAALSTQSVTVTAVAHTLSFLGTGTVTLSGTSTAGPLVGTGADNRVSLTFTPTAGSLTLTVTGTVSNAQLETGTIATSIVPTFGATATRAFDNYSFLLSTIPALGSEYSIYVRFATPSIASTRYAMAVTDGTANEFAGFAANTTLRLGVTDGGVAVGTITGATLVANTFASVAGRFKLNDCAMSVDGAAVGTDTTVTLPTVTQVRLGNSTNGGAFAVFNIAKLIIVPRAWSDAELQTKSTT